jgi:hypothetical protein
LKNIYDKFEMSPEEIDFIERTVEADNDNHNLAFIGKKIVFSTFYLAKQIESSSKSNDTHSNRMFWLTIVIGLFSAVQVVELLLKLCGII